MKKLLSVFACILLLCPSLVFAEDMKKDNSAYVSVSGMVVIVEDTTINFKDTDLITGGVDFDTGFGVSVATGRKFGNFRGEIEYSLRKSSQNLQTLNFRENGYYTLPNEENDTVHLFMINGLYDFNLNSLVTPYVGAGLGFGFEEEAEGVEFAYQLLAGINYEVAPKTDLILGYRYTGMTDLDYSEQIHGLEFEYTASLDSHNFEFGIRYSF